MIRILDLSAILVLVGMLVLFIAFRKHSPKLCFLTFILGFVIISFRTIGDDTIQYVSIYESLVPAFDSFALQNVSGFIIEPFWFYLISALKTLGFSTPYLFFFVSSFVPAMAVVWVYKKSKLFNDSFDKFFFSLFWLMLYQFAINGVRAYASTCFVLMAVWLFYNSKYIKCAIVSMIAVLLHTSGFILVAFLLILKLRLNKRSVFFISVIFIISLIVLMQLDLSDPYFVRIFAKLDYYLFAVESDMVANNKGRELYVFFARSFFVVTIIYSFFILLLSVDVYRENGFINGLYKCSLITIIACLAMLFCGIYLFSYRIVMFIQPFILLIFSFSLSSKPKRYKLPLFLMSTAWYWLFFILFASRFYDS